QSKARLLNLGCGSIFHKDWINIDFHDYGGSVIAYDLRLGVPFADESVDVIYHSHVLEHFTRENAKKFLEDCFRTLRPGGLMRVVVPDLENIVRAYLASLEEAEQGGKEASERHEWMTIELLDQMTRTHSGGEMLKFWCRRPVPQEDFVTSRVGHEFISFKNSPGAAQAKIIHERPPLPQLDFAFYMGGELHRWMYDIITLQQVLSSCGFTDITRQKFNTSLNDRILAYGLDAADDGTIRKPDSLYLEARRPVESSKNKKVKVAIISTTDAEGAGIACLRQHKSLLNTDICTEMYVSYQVSSSQNLHILPGKGDVSRVGLSECAALSAPMLGGGNELAKYTNRPQGLEIFSATTHCADLGAVPFFEDFDVINLHWVTNFLDVTASFNELKDRPVVWTLHDMRSFTGGCHYAGDCRKYTEHCGACPQLGSSDPNDLSFRTWKEAKETYRRLDMHIVAPSNWLANEAKKSSLFRRFPVHVIPHAQPLGVFNIKNKKLVRQGMGLGADELVLTFAAQNLKNHRKGIAYLLTCLRAIAKSPLKEKTHLMLLGSTPPDEFFQLGIKATPFGHVNDPNAMATLYNAADGVIVPSLEDNSPNVICEAAGCGVPVIAFAVGGIPEMIRHKETGWLALPKDAAGLADGIHWLAENRHDPLISKRCRAFALETWNESKRAQQYAALFSSLKK
ncbi:glycosyltransferase, partial [Desulfovibrio sp. OttesenSCG-928-F20]|nr:glycosyltransferase [Desulfovibrio sp. OttesenSCG-928-F20]